MYIEVYSDPSFKAHSICYQKGKIKLVSCQMYIGPYGLDG